MARNAITGGTLNKFIDNLNIAYQIAKIGYELLDTDENISFDDRKKIIINIMEK